MTTRNRRSARNAGTRFERLIADYLATQLGDDRIDRRPRAGAKDRGDIAGMRAHGGQRIVIEVKDTSRVCLPEWIAEAHTEAGNDDALVGIVIHKRQARSAPGEQWVTMTVDDLLACLYGQRFDGLPAVDITAYDTDRDPEGHADMFHVPVVDGMPYQITHIEPLPPTGAGAEFDEEVPW